MFQGSVICAVHSQQGSVVIEEVGIGSSQMHRLLAARVDALKGGRLASRPKHAQGQMLYG